MSLQDTTVLYASYALTYPKTFYMCGLRDASGVSALYTQNFYHILLRYALSVYNTVELQSADTHDIRRVMLGTRFSRMVHIRRHS